MANIFVVFMNIIYLKAAIHRVYTNIIWMIICPFLILSVEAVDFHLTLISLHPSLRFTMEVESDTALPFLDVLVDWKRGRLLLAYIVGPPLLACTLIEIILSQSSV